MKAGNSCPNKIYVKSARISTVHVVFLSFLVALLLVENSMGMSDKILIYKGYCIAEHELASGQRVGILKTTILNIRWLLTKDQSEVTHVQICDLTVTNLKTGMPVTTEKVNSPVIKVKLLSTSLENGDERLRGVAWIIRDDAPINQMREFVDYRVSGIAVELSENKELNRKKFEIFLKRDYKTVPDSTLRGVDNWTVGAAHLISRDSSPVAYFYDSSYDKKLRRILKIYNYGTLSIKNGEIVFEEIADKRKVYYSEMINEEYKMVNGFPKRVWDYKKHYVDSLPYAYKTIYERGYSND